MDRQTVYAGQVPLETDLLNTNRNVLIALGKMLGDMLGTSTFATGLGCGPTSPASMSVQVQPGQLYALQNLDNTPYSSLPADTSHQIVKQGIALNAQSFACSAPTTAGYSVNYLIEANYADTDTSPVVLAFYNASNPSQAFSGPGGNGQPSMTTRAGQVILTLKSGVAAASGSQVTPAVDSGCIGLWVVTVAYGQSTITAGNVSQYGGAPLLPTSLLQSLITNNLEYGVDKGPSNALQATFPIAPTSISDNQQFWVKVNAANTGAATFTPNPGVIGAAPVVGAAHQALQGGELVANGRALLIYRADIASYVLESCTGAAMQTAPATKSQHAVQQSQLGSLSGIGAFGSSTTLTAGNFGNLIICNGSSAFTLTLPPAASAGTSGSAIHFLNQQSTNVVIQCSGSDNIVGGTSVVPSTAITPGGTLSLSSNGSNWYVGGGTAGLRFSQRVLVNTNSDDGSSALQINGFATASSPNQFDNSPKLAPTSFVQRAIGSYSGVSVLTSASTLTAAATGQINEINGTSSFTTTLPAGASVGSGGVMAFVNQSGVNQTVATQGSDSIWSYAGGLVSSIVLRPGDSLELFSRVGQWDISGGSTLLQYSASFGSSMGTAGYQKLPSGLIIQWGATPVVAGSGTATINYPIAFPSAFFGCVPMGGKISPNQGSNLILNSLGGSLTQFQAVNTGASQVDGGCFFAWGK